jgi:FAD/FMN-containing dehydrogenase
MALPTMFTCCKESFGRCNSSTSLCCEPASIAEVQEVFAYANAKGLKVTIRGAGHSFDGQAVQYDDLGTPQILMLTTKFTSIEVEPGSVTVGAGATWKDILEATTHHPKHPGIPEVIQTGQLATAGGTLAANVLSRFMRRESTMIESFLFVPASGDEPFMCFPAINPSAIENTTFYAAIGGLGYLGFVTNIKYRLAPFDPSHCAHTQITTYSTLPKLVAALFAKSEKAERLRTTSKSGHMAGLTAVSSALFLSPLFKTPRGGIFESKYAPPTDNATGFPLYQDLQTKLRYDAELASRDNALNFAVHFALYQYVNLRGRWVHRTRRTAIFENDIDTFTFFMDGNTFAKKEFERKTGQKMPIIQQSYILPRIHTEAFAKDCIGALRKAAIHAAMFDIIAVRGDEAWLSGSYHLDGYVVSLAFEPPSCDHESVAEIEKMLMKLSELAYDKGGRLHLAKNVHVDALVFQEMFGGQWTAFLKLKETHDPGNILVNPFFERLFTPLLPERKRKRAVRARQFPRRPSRRQPAR